MIRLGTILEGHARYRPDHIAIVFEEHRITYKEFNARVNRLANALNQAGIRKGTKVATVLGNCLELVEVYWATAKIGAVVVPMSPLLNPSGLAALLQHSNAELVFVGSTLTQGVEAIRTQLDTIRPDRFVVVEGESHPGFVPYEDFVAGASSSEPSDPGVNEHDSYMIIYSSGTTGEPKGITLSHYARGMYCTLYGLAWRMTPESISLHTGSLVFNGSFMTLFPSFFLGGTFVLMRKFNPDEVIDTISRERITHMMVVPSQIIAMMGSRSFGSEALASLEALISLGSTLHLEHKQRLHAALPTCVYELYGLAEGFMTILDKTHFGSRMNSVGTPPPFFQMRIVGDDGRESSTGEVGEIVGRGPILMSGYHSRPDLTEKAIIDGWLHSGDLGYVDTDGYLYLVDRKKDMIKSGGVSVYPRDIEEVIVQHPAVSDAAVFGIPDERWGEMPVAAVTLDPMATISKAELHAWINSNVSAKFQRVCDVVIMTEFPLNAAGKPLKRSIRELYLATRDTAE